MDIESRIANLDKRMQEYIELGKKMGMINNENIERVISRLERVKISVDNSIVGDARIESDRDNDSVNIKLNQNRIQQEINNGKYYFEDEVLFHEFTHSISSLYENSIETGDAYKFKKNFLKESEKDDYVDDYSYIKDYMNNEEKEKFDKYVNEDKLHLAGYGWILLDEFVAQTVAQKMVKRKHNDRGIYAIKAHDSSISNPPYRFYSDLADYEVFTPFSTKFIESMYGTKDIENFCKDSLDSDFIDKIFENFQKRPDGLEHLYKMLGNMGNIFFANEIERGHITEEQLDKRDPSHYSENKENIYNSIKEFMSIADKEVSEFNYEEAKKSDIVVEDYNEKQEQESVDEKQENINEENQKNVADNEQQNAEQQKMETLVNQLNEVIKKMTKDYVSRNHEDDLKNQEDYQKIISSMVDLRISEGGKQISNIDRMMELRRLDATASNLVIAFRNYASDLKYKIDTNKSEEKINYELKYLQNYLKSDIELQNGEKIVINKNENDQSNNENKISNQNDNMDKKSNLDEDELKLKIRYSAQDGKYIIENTNETIPERILKSKKDKIKYIKDNFDDEHIEYIFGKNFKKAIKKCDLQLITILTDFNIDCAKHYVKTMTENEEQKELPYSMVYDLRNMNKNKNLSLFDKIKLRILAKRNKEKNAAEIVEREQLLESNEVNKPALDEKSQVEQYKESLSSEISQNQAENAHINDENQNNDKDSIYIEDNER